MKVEARIITTLMLENFDPSINLAEILSNKLFRLIQEDGYTKEICEKAFEHKANGFSVEEIILSMDSKIWISQPIEIKSLTE